jgi:hypothetical protein
MNNNNNNNNNKNNKNKNYRLAQLEIVGLVVIVVIVLVAIMAYLVFKINSPENNEKRMFVNKASATYFLISMNKVSVAECPFHTLGSLIVDCAGMQEIICGVKDSCEATKDTLDFLLNASLDSYGLDKYNLSIKGTGISVGKNCHSRMPGVQGLQVLPLRPGEVEITLRICD